MEAPLLEELNPYRETVFNGFTDDEVKDIISVIRKETYEAGETLFEEDDEGDDLYLLIEGEVKILKKDEHKLFHVNLVRLKSPDIFGEISFLNSSVRSSTVETSKSTTLLILSKKELFQTKDGQTIFEKMSRNIQLILNRRLHETNIFYTKLFRGVSGESRRMQGWTNLLFFTALVGGAWNVVFYFSSNAVYKVDEPWLNWLYWWVFGISSLLLIYGLKINRNDLQLTMQNVKQGFPRLITYAIGALVLFLTSALMASSEYPHFSLWWLLGYFLFCAAYEFIGRGILINAINQVFKDREGFVSVPLSAIFLTVIPLPAYYHLGMTAPIVCFLMNGMLGMLFFKTKNLAAMVLLHFFLGIVLVYFLGNSWGSL